jgi:hypothetical protein
MDASATILDISPGALSDYYDWLKDSKHGDTLIYWQGDLQFDRQVVVPASDVMRSDERSRIAALNTVADRVRIDAKSGVLLLTQKRIGFGIFEYRAQRVRPTYHAPKTVQPNDDLVLA